MLNKQPIHVVQRDCKQWSLQAVDVLQALCWQSLVSSVGMQLLNVDENQKRRCRTVSSYISIYHMILENYFDNCVCFTFCIFLGIAVLVSHCCYSSLYGIVMGCQALFEQGPLNHWLHRVPFQRCHQLSSWALPSRGIAQPARGPTRPRASALDSSRRSNQLRPAAESNAALGFGHCCNIRRLAQRRSAAWRCIDMYSCIYINICEVFLNGS